MTPTAIEAGTALHLLISVWVVWCFCSLVLHPGILGHEMKQIAHIISPYKPFLGALAGLLPEALILAAARSTFVGPPHLHIRTCYQGIVSLVYKCEDLPARVYERLMLHRCLLLLPQQTTLHNICNSTCS